jgi:hypothetical protein
MIMLISANELPCQESSDRFPDRPDVKCGRESELVIDNGDQRVYPMCGAHALHNVTNRRARVVLQLTTKLRTD